jgi:hypothetical protein
MNFLVNIQPSLEFMFEVGPRHTAECVQKVLRRLYAFAEPKLTHHYVFGDKPYEMVMTNTDRLGTALEDLSTLTSNHPESIHWSTTTFYGELTKSGAPSTSLTVSIGWLKAQNDVFGVSVRLHYSIHKNLLELAKQSLLEIDTKLSWAILVNRFVPPLQFDGRFVDGYRDIYYLSKRFPIVDIGDELNLNTSYWRDNLRTIGWWNYLGPKFASRLPIDIFNKADSNAGFSIQKHNVGGVVLSIDGEPTLGDVNKAQFAPRSLLSIYKRLEQLIPATGIDFLEPWSSEETIDWLHRWKTLHYQANPNP